MKTTTSRLLAACGGVLFALFSAMGARADDTEIFFSQNIGNIPANILFILDTSGSMNDTVTTQTDYDPKKSYSADSCPSGSNIDGNSYYYSNKGAPTCSSTNKINMKQFVCASMVAPIDASGYATDAFIQWGSTTSNSSKKKSGITTTTSTQTYKWQGSLSATNTTGYVECKLDAGVNGDGGKITGTLQPYPTTDTYTITTTTVTPPGTVTSTSTGTASTTGLWDALATKNYFKSGTGTVYTIYSPNYLNWLYDSKQTTTASKMWIMRGAASSLLNSLQGVNVGLARYDQKGNGGMILAPVLPIDTGTNRTDMIKLVNGIKAVDGVDGWAPDGTTPLSETLYEAYLYFSGGNVLYGNNSYTTACTTWSTTNYTCSASTTTKALSVPASRTGGTAASKTYDSPSDYSCRKNFIVYLTDGLPNEKGQSDAAIKALPNFTQLGGACDAAAFKGATGGLCTAALAQYMYNADLRPDVQKVQNVTSYFIGFGVDFQSNGAPTAAFNYLQNAATRGGGKAYTADSLAGLTDAFNKILGEVIKTNTTFSAPAVAVNAFNRTQTLNDLYVSVFSPRSEFHWPGNVKKYKLINGVVTDALGKPAVDAGTGFFIDGSQSYWSGSPDGSDVTLGGAASKLPLAAKRTLYTTEAPGIGSYPKLIALTDSALTATDFNLGATDPAQADLVNWAYGLDVLDQVAPAGTTDTRHEMGDPIHTQPVAVIYGKNADGTDDTVIYAPTNDGYLHAIDASVAPSTGADVATSGQELWAYVPNAMLSQLKNLYTDDSASGVYVKHYGLDGAISVLKYDVNGDGTINGDDRVILFFGTGRNASTSAYYALDVTDKNKPVLLWRIDALVLPNLGQAWSTPVITRVNINGATQNSQKLVLVIGGGYDAAEDNYTYQASDNVGKAVYMVDAIYGTLLWSAGQTGATLNLARMDHAIPAPISVLDLDGDTYADRLYFGDMAAQLWRIDITNGNSAATLATGGVLASLGTHDDLIHLPINTRRFYSAVDPSLEQAPGMPSFLNLAIGTGYRGHPLDGTANDRFYSVRDYDAFTSQTQTWFTNYNIVRDAISGGTLATNKLVDITATAAPVMAVGAAGWQLDMNTHPDWTSAEKVLAPSRTFNGQVLFTSYQPNTAPPTDPCTGVGTGTNRIYVVDVFSGAPVIDRNKDGALTTSERSQDLRQGGIAPEAAFLFPAPANASSTNGGGAGLANSGTVTCLSGVEVLNVCSNLNRVRKTYWREGAAN